MCAELLDLYGSVTVGKSQFMYPQIVDYGAIGQYDCDAKCDAEYGPEGNIQFKSGAVSDFRGVFCFQRKVLQEANYPLLDFMFRAAARSYRINRNRALMVGDGINQPLGWLHANCFTKLATSNRQVQPHRFRLFFASSRSGCGSGSLRWCIRTRLRIWLRRWILLASFIFGRSGRTLAGSVYAGHPYLELLALVRYAGLGKGSRPIRSSQETSLWLLVAGLRPTTWSKSAVSGWSSGLVSPPHGASNTCSVRKTAASPLAAPQPAFSASDKYPENLGY